MHVPLTPVRALYRAVDLFGGKVGVVSGECRFPYSEFGERCERLAFGLLSEGVAPGDRVAFLSFNTHQLLGGSATFFNDESTVELHTIPLFHANGWGRPQCATFHGLKQVMVRRFDPASVLRLIQEERATSMLVVPTMANALLHCPEFGRFD